MTNLELLNDLIKQAEQIERGNGKLDIVQKRAEMLVRKIFGDQSTYLKSLNEISYSPMMWTTGTSPSVFESSFYRGKTELLNLLNVIAEDVQLDSQLISSQIGSSKKPLSISKNIFVVHGHNEEMKLAAARTLEKLELKPIILHEQANKGKTIIEKFTDHSVVDFALVLLSADDVAYERNQNPETAKFRARQNVIFELGYFLGSLGRSSIGIT